MKTPHRMRLDELIALPTFTAVGVLDRAAAFGGCFRDPDGRLWGTCLIDDPWVRFPGTWARFPAVQLASHTGLSEDRLREQSSLIGCFDSWEGSCLIGWAQDLADPDAMVQLDVSVNGRCIGTAFANRYRVDLEDAGIGDGRHGFEFELPAPLSRNVTQIAVAQRSTDGAVLDVAVSPARPPAVFDTVPTAAIEGAATDVHSPKPGTLPGISEG